LDVAGPVGVWKCGRVGSSLSQFASDAHGARDQKAKEKKERSNPRAKGCGHEAIVNVARMQDVEKYEFENPDATKWSSAPDGGSAVPARG
jgi:hypothetical protein